MLMLGSHWCLPHVVLGFFFLQKHHFFSKALLYLHFCWDHNSFSDTDVLPTACKSYQLTSEEQYNLVFIFPPSHWRIEEANILVHRRQTREKDGKDWATAAQTSCADQSIPLQSLAHHRTTTVPVHLVISVYQNSLSYCLQLMVL